MEGADDAPGSEADFLPEAEKYMEERIVSEFVMTSRTEYSTLMSELVYRFYVQQNLCVATPLGRREKDVGAVCTC